VNTRRVEFGRKNPNDRKVDLLYEEGRLNGSRCREFRVCVIRDNHRHYAEREAEKFAAVRTPEDKN
jgi:hypothetical protein